MNMIGSKAKVMKDLRALWEVEVGTDATDIDSDLNVAYKAVINGNDASKEAMLACIRDTGAWKSRQVMVAESTFSLIKEREPTQRELDSLVCLSTVAEITDAINHLDEHMAEFYSNKEISTEDIDHDMVGDVQMPERYRDDANHYDSIIIDHDWMDEFKEVYAREPLVYEYVYLRRMRETPIAEIYEKFTNVKSEIESIYTNYLDTQISDADFIKKFIPELFDNSDLVEQTVHEITSSDEYANAMKKRLSQVHERLFSTLDSSDAEYIFETRVKAERLALTEDLNLVVISFREETDKHNSMMAEIWMSVLKRMPCEQEMSKYKARYRENSTYANEFVQKALLGSLEFSGVVKARIEEMYPDMPIYEVYNVVTSVCEDPDIITHTLEDVIRTTCGET
jgi:hypothetical protein